MELFIYLNGEKRGPFSRERVDQLVSEGLVRPTDLAALSSSGELKPLADLTTAARAHEPAVTPAKADPPHVPPQALGTYSRATLAPNETAYLRTSLHWIIFVRFAVLGLLLLVFVALPFAVAVQALTGSELGWFALPLPAFAMVAPAVAYGSSELVVTNLRVLIKTGVIRRQTLEMFVSKVESIAVDQSFLGRMLDYGTVVIRGTGGFQEPFETIARPLEFRNCVQRLQSSPASASAT
ncbi:MAG TPA: PH domain-containing protein [Chthoniobacterales bacterium]